ncbi:flagellar hook assembly protein FlgD [Salinibacillus xinjiangensis]|uniref:Flagellar hook assembly protein FlgD n=1 Tax=Salinibacillus xinjiangensis TaxID=1229268 RepID=A0A6G1X3B6_9BACI|nr:flagellar hook assembly protein FlgD [Salinibacillus xinjiangensis]MRG85396.1 flagellar hook assembly protein FlgD [Salinibacillus xinjiangensis]
MTKIDPSLFLANQTTEKTSNNQLGKDDFLKILMTQLQNQDPSNPMEDKEFISQMANFSSLEQLMAISKSMNGLVQSQSMNSVIEYSHLIDRQVEFNVYNEDGSVEKTGNGIVEGVSMGESGIELVLQNGEKVSVHSITEIKNASEVVE